VAYGAAYAAESEQGGVREWTSMRHPSSSKEWEEQGVVCRRTTTWGGRRRGAASPTTVTASWGGTKVGSGRDSIWLGESGSGGD
jgi:hypothetical protein